MRVEGKHVNAVDGAGSWFGKDGNIITQICHLNHLAGFRHEILGKASGRIAPERGEVFAEQVITPSTRSAFSAKDRVV